MVFFNHATRQMTAKIVYYGPGLCGKTTNLNTIYGRTSQKARGEMVSLNTETDRTLFFDLLPMDVGVVGGFKTKLQLYTVPGQVFYNSTRKLVLKGVDGVVFVVDSQVPMLDANRESIQNLEANLKELGMDLRDIPMVFQWNKRDLKNVVPVEELERELNPRGHLSFQSNAQEGAGVFETLRGITKLALGNIKLHHFAEVAPAKTEAPPAPADVPVSVVSEAPAEALAMEDLAEPVTEAGAIMAPPPSPLDLSDLHPVGAVLDEESLGSNQPSSGKLPTLMPEAHAPTVPSHAAPVAHRPVARPMTPSRPAVNPLTLSLPVIPKLRSPNPKAAVSALLGDLSQGGFLGSPSVVKLELPNHLDETDLEVVVQIRSKGKVIAENQLKRTAPSHGMTSRLTIEIKRS